MNEYWISVGHCLYNILKKKLDEDKQKLGIFYKVRKIYLLRASSSERIFSPHKNICEQYVFVNRKLKLTLGAPPKNFDDQSLTADLSSDLTLTTQ